MAGTPFGVTVAASSMSGQGILRHCYAAALHAVEPTHAMARALESAAPPTRPVALLSAGKAAGGMAEGLVAWLKRHHAEPVSGLIISPGTARPPHPAMKVVPGDHPVPGEASQRASDAVAHWLAQLPTDVDVHVAISGGTSAMLAGPLPGLSMADVTRTFELLLASGLDIVRTNAIRKRVARWSAGRLALALHPRPIATWLLSDVPDDDPQVIGSGPCHGDRWSSRDVMALCRSAGLMNQLPSAVIAALEFETPKPTHPGATAEHTQVVASNRVAMEAARSCAIALGCHAKVMPKPLSGPAHLVGEQIGLALTHVRGSRFGNDDTLGEAGRPRVFIYGGETTVALTGTHGVGGRNQELALAAAGKLHDQGHAVSVLAAGTDGRDGPTDAAGAIVDQGTWSAIAARMINPALALQRHDSYRALDAAGALLRTGFSGTNVMDLVLAVVLPASVTGPQ